MLTDVAAGGTQWSTQGKDEVNEWGDNVARGSSQEVIQQFCAYQRKRNLSTNTVRVRRLRLTALADGLAPKHVLDATTKDLDRWLESLPIAPQTRYTYISHLSAFYLWAATQRLTKRDNPAEDLIRPKLPKRLPRPWDEQELARAVEVAGPRMRAWLLLAWFAGARVMEMQALRAEDIRDGMLLLRGKGNKERVVPLHPEVRAALNSYGVPKSGYVFRRLDGHPMRPSSISVAISRFLKEQGIAATAHMGRHRYATNLYRLTNDPFMLAELMGHTDVNTSRLYAQLTGSKATGIIGMMHLPNAGG